MSRQLLEPPPEPPAEPGRPGDRPDPVDPSSSLGRLLRFWGKARPETEAGPRWHPLVYHCLDVAAAGVVLVGRRGPPRGLAALFGDRWPGALGYLLALHDIGKLSRPFQAQSPEHWPAETLGRHQPPVAGVRHDALGLTLLNRLLSTKARRQHPLSDWRPDAWEQALVLLTPFVAHHGRPVAPGNVKVFDPELDAGHDFLDLMTTLFQPDLPPPPVAMDAVLFQVSWELAGLTVLADWLGSNQGWFPYHPDPVDPAWYWKNRALPQAETAVEQAGQLPGRANPDLHSQDLIGAGHPPSPVQHWAATVVPPEGPVLALIEDMTGSGKTEAALILAHRLMADGRAQGVYFALPTMATANALYTRLEKSYRRLFAAGHTPSLALAHGASALHPGFRDSVAALPAPERSGDPPDRGEHRGDEAGASCAAWLADSRRKAFLADVGVGTIDQALLAVLPAKYQSLRLLGLGRLILVVDEAHAYDTYMATELERLLEFQAALGGSAIVLSATLPLVTRRALAQAFARGLGAAAPEPARTDYPLATVTGAGGTSETACGTRPELERPLAVSRLAAAGEAVQRIVEAARAGAAVAWVRNTVDDAFAAFEALQAGGLQAGGVPVTLFHARAAMGDRLKVEAGVIGRFGKDGNPTDRPGVLVATQVIEQSLDLDFDLMVSDLAPIDLLLQRAGRLWRHRRERPPAVTGPHLLVLSPEPGDTVGPEWVRATLPGTAAVYPDHGRLWLSARTLFAQPEWRSPEDVRALVEAVYGPDPLGRIPEGLRHRALKAEGDSRAAGSLAEANLLKVANGYHDDHPGWAEDTRIPTRLGDETTTLRLARWHDDGTLHPWCGDQDPHRAWALSEVALRVRRAHDTPKLAAAQAAAANRVRAAWTRHDAEKLLVPLEPAGDDLWRGTVIGEKGETTPFTYTRLQGLQFSGRPR